jgi:hypothetical protein
MYPFHKEANIYDLLYQFRVGTLHPDDILDEKNLLDFTELQHQDLPRVDHVLMQKFPYCSQTNPKFLGDPEFFFTPSTSMYERNHNLIPEIEIEDYELSLLKARTEEAEENALVYTLE